jgi:putative nucleotidyltransferase with HDIG domain
MVARLSRRTAERLALTDHDRGVACFGGLLHDIGKIGISDGVLNKPGKLLPEEWDLMQSHVRVGRDLLERVPLLKRLSDVVMYHHERWDGAGYPDGLQGESIPQAARIVCVVDSYCAMISKRSYKESITDDQARAELLRHRGTQFDPRVVDAFLEVLDTPDPAAADPEGGSVKSGDFYHVLRGGRESRN